MELPINYGASHWKVRGRARAQYAKEQGGKCYHCGFTLGGGPSPKMARLPIERGLFPNGFFNHPIHLHHSHETGLTIGAVHAQCNAILWQYHGE